MDFDGQKWQHHIYVLFFVLSKILRKSESQNVFLCHQGTTMATLSLVPWSENVQIDVTIDVYINVTIDVTIDGITNSNQSHTIAATAEVKINVNFARRFQMTLLD